VRPGEVGVGEQVGFSVEELLGDGGEPALQAVDDCSQLVACGGGIGLGEHGADRGGDHLRVPLGDLGQCVADEVQVMPNSA
jgi:hypothetical protein